MSKTNQEFILGACDRVLSGGLLGQDDAVLLASVNGADLVDLVASANRVRDHFRGPAVDICSIVNAKSGACSEDCRYCAQSSHYSTNAPVYPLLDVDRMEEAARGAKQNGAGRFCIVTSGRGIDDAADLRNIARGIERVRALGLRPCATLGTITVAAENILPAAPFGANPALGRQAMNELQTQTGSFIEGKGGAHAILERVA